ncbi:MAG TPA: type II toxin-antitoxin system VapC family toxin [Terriglobales bacterium]|nr:type II toxin-antitoxin system VapC family toxin [Terriglobales bacterium]
MKLLLDTHIWIWSAIEPRRLSGRVLRALSNQQNELWLSPISVWELVMLTEKGRIELDEDVLPWTRRTMEELRLQEAPLTIEVALATSNLNLPHSDPSDRLIAAATKVFDLTLVTADEKLIAAPNIKILANR